MLRLIRLQDMNHDVCRRADAMDDQDEGGMHTICSNYSISTPFPNLAQTTDASCSSSPRTHEYLLFRVASDTID